jgi:hypothetical protein
MGATAALRSALAPRCRGVDRFRGIAGAGCKSLLVSAISTEHEALDRYLSPPVLGLPVTILSTFWAALRDARQATGRNAESGDVIDPPRLGSWLGAVGYLCLLDQIGSTVRPRQAAAGPDRGSGNSISRALEHWTSCTVDERAALYALRCSFAHDFGLLNPSAHPRLRQAFHLREDGPLVTLPAKRWDGSYPVTRDVATTVNLREVGDLVEQIQARVRDAHRDSRLQLALKSGVAEFNDRCVLMIMRGT